MSALNGVRVLDLARGGAGSLASGLLAGCGADVIKVVDVDPRMLSQHPADLADWVFWNRSKRIATLSSPDDLDRVASLAHSSDVVVVEDEGVLDEFRIEWPKGSPRPVLLTMPPHDVGSAPWAGGAESPELLEALSGLPSVQASFSGGPIAAVYPYLRTAQAAWGAACAVAALIDRERSNAGQRVTVTGLHAINAFGISPLTRPENEPDPDRAIGPAGLNPMYTRYRAGDGIWLFMGGLGPKFVALIIEHLGLQPILNDPRIGGRPERMWHIDNSAWVMQAIQDLISKEPAHHWIDLLETADIPCTLLEDREEWFRSEQMEAMHQRVETADPVLGPIEITGPIADFVATPGKSTAPEAPVAVADVAWAVGQHSSLRREGVKRPASTGEGPLSGYRAAVFGSFVAGPYVGPLLAELGMDVAKIEPLAGDPWRVQGLSVNRGPRSLAIDLSTVSGRKAVMSVLRDRDVVIDNFRLGVMARLGLDHESLKLINPTVVTTSVTAYGERGPLAAKPGYDPVLQAASGMMTAQGGDDEPVVYSMPPVDLTTAIVSTFATVVALYHREVAGVAQHVSTALGTTATYLQGADLVTFAGRPPGRRGGRDFRGATPSTSMYEVADGWIRLGARTVQPADLITAGLEINEAAFAEDPRAELSRVFATLSQQTAISLLTAAGIPAVPSRKMSEVAVDPALHEAGYLGWLPMDDGRRMAAPKRLASFSRTPRTDFLRAPGLGEHSRELLREAGLANAEIDELISSGTVIAGEPMRIIHMPTYR